MRARVVLGLAALLLLVLLAELGLAVTTDGLTYDELAYIACGYRHLVLSDFRPNFEQPPLAKLAVGVPLLWLRPQLPEWLPDDNFWAWSRRFVHEANDANLLIPVSRITPVILTLALALLVFTWARSALGDVAALAALFVTVFHPSLLAHGHLATTDVATALAMTATSWAFWRWQRQPSLAWAGLTALLGGAALATRLTSWLLLPALAALAALGLRGARRRSRRALRHGLVLAAACLLLAPGVIWASYGFRFAPWPGSRLAVEVASAGGWPGRIVQSLDRWQALPEAYLAGAAAILALRSQGWPAYLLGELSMQGWRYYYVVAFLVKNTPGLLLLCAVALASWVRRPSLGPQSVALHWLLPATAVFTTASLMRVQIGERYVLAAYPYLILLLGGAAARLWRNWRGRGLLALCLVLHALPSVAIAERGYLTYFNLLAGGPDGGREVLLDSNLDWGQDLPRLARWMQREGVERIQLGYFGRDDPRRLGIRHRDLPGSHSCEAGPPRVPLSGVVVVSPNLLSYLAPEGAPYASLVGRQPDDRVGALLVFRLPRPGADPVE
jgi:hypothetical protein